MYKKTLLLISFALLPLLINSALATTYYVSPTGNDNNSGTSPTDAWATTGKVNSMMPFAAGDSILFEGGETFSGGLVFTSGGTPTSPITISSYGSGRATINSDLEEIGLHVLDCAGFEIKDLILLGSGNAGGTQFTGLEVQNTTGTKLDYIRIDNVEISEYRGIGLHFGGADFEGFRDVRITNTVVHDVGKGGITTGTSWPVHGDTHLDLYIGDCLVYDVTGIPGVGPHSGSGIIFGGVNGGVIEFCEAYNTGALNDAEGGGPLGIWCWESINVTFQFDESHHNKTTAGDGGGFDFDGGTSFSTSQYNYSHDNYGGNLIMHFSRSRYTGDNIFRYNISANDSQFNGMGGVTFYAEGTFENVDVYNNTLYAGPDSVSGASALTIWSWRGRFSNMNIRNNIFIAEPGQKVVYYPSDGLVGFTFQNNVYWQHGAPLKITEKEGPVYDSLEAWRTATGQEMLDGQPVGLEVDPQLVDVTDHPVVHPHNWANLTGYKLKSASACIDYGLDLQALFGINPGTQDFYGNSIPQGTAYDIGHHEYPGGGTPDTDPPTPDPMTWATVPYATGDSSIAMVATTASDASGVEYYFDCTTTGGHDSYWQESTSYEDTGLSPSTTYTYQVLARDKSYNQNESAASTAESATTLAADTTPPTPDPMTFATAPYSTGFYTIAMEATTATDESGCDVEYYFECTAGGGHDSGWQSSTFYEDSGLELETQYTYRVKARDTSTNLNETGWSAEQSATTDAYQGTTFYFDGFESGDFIAGGWAKAGKTTVESTAAYTGNYGAHLGKLGALELVISTEGLTNIRIRYMRRTEWTKGHIVKWWDGENAHVIESIKGDHPWEMIDVICGPLADNNPDFRLMFTNVSEHPSNQWGEVDDVELMGEGGEPDVNAPTPDPMTWATVPYATGSSSIAMVATTASDASGVEYYFDCTTTGGHDSGWQDSTSYVDTGLSPETQYCYKVQARDKSPNQNATGWSTTECATTEPAGPEPDMYVYDIAMSWYESKAGYYVATATMWIKDVSLNDISDATVTSDWSGAWSETGAQGVTGADGKTTIESKAVKGGGTYTFCVTDVSATGYTYNPALNVETCDSVTAP